jgi:acyl transferase domain-containing protein
VSIAGRYPGSSPDAGIPGFWGTLEREGDLPSTIPLQRWDVDEYYSPEGKGRQLSMYVRRAAFVQDVDHFDASLFR